MFLLTLNNIYGSGLCASRLFNLRAAGLWTLKGKNTLLYQESTKFIRLLPSHCLDFINAHEKNISGSKVEALMKRSNSRILNYYFIRKHQSYSGVQMATLKNHSLKRKEKIIEDIKEAKHIVRGKIDGITEKENIWTIPNFLCVSRICLSPVLCAFVLTSQYQLAMGTFLFAGFTDLVDGWIARTFPSQASQFGSYLDPLADKILIASLFLTLTYAGMIPYLLTMMIISRDIVLIGCACYVRYKSLSPPRTLSRYFDASRLTAQLKPTLISKINTGVQLGLIATSLAAPVFGFTDHFLLKGMWVLTAATTVGSGLSYIFSPDAYKIIPKDS